MASPNKTPDDNDTFAFDPFDFLYWHAPLSWMCCSSAMVALVLLACFYAFLRAIGWVP